MPAQTVAIVIHEGVQALDVAGPVDVFAEANAYLPADDRYVVLLVAADRQPLRASNGMWMLADLGQKGVRFIFPLARVPQKGDGGN
ncbi:hypothetical protein ACFWZ1_12495 [Frateuria sp. GZRe14]|uniref:hypothetical protein n=1 Tax=Frateuria sp. GZRe14 TaxID=3351534 RepID=UPI003EDBDE55